MNLDILAIGAHPDDVELTCSGTIAKAVKNGCKVGILDLTEGELGTRGNNVIRAKEAKAAADILGCVRENLSLPDGNIELTRANKLKVIQVFRKYRPKLILIPHFAERHPDHVSAHHLCREAWFYSGLRKIETKLNGKKQEPWRPKNYFNYMQWQEFTPSFIVDITDVFEQRMKAIKAHASQFHDPSSTEPQTLLSQQSFLDFVETRAKNYGYAIGVKYGEPFYSVQPIGILDIFSLKMFHG
jgi:bacillithiol biosynthesis deacetylase BshB1